MTAPGEWGEFGVLPNHIAFLSTLVPGELTYKQGATKTTLAVSGGYAEVLDNVMTVLARGGVSRRDRHRPRATRQGARRNIDDRS